MPSRIESSASSKSSWVTVAVFLRAARSAASLARLARSAPEKPGVDWAMSPRFTDGASGILLEWILQDRLPAGAVRERDRDLTIEAARSQQGRVEDVGAVGGGEDDDARLVVEAVHLDEELVEGLLALVVAAAEARASLSSDGVDLVDEHDRGCRGLGLREQVADAAGTDAHEELHELRGGDAEEGHRGLAGDGACHQGLAGARRADEQHAPRAGVHPGGGTCRAA